MDMNASRIRTFARARRTLCRGAALACASAALAAVGAVATPAAGGNDGLSPPKPAAQSGAAAPAGRWSGVGTFAATTSADELAVFFEPGARVAAARRAALARRLGAVGPPLPGSNAFVMFVRLVPGDMAAAAARGAGALKDTAGVRAVSPVYYGGVPGESGRMALTGDVVVRYASRAAAEAGARWAAADGLAVSRPISGRPRLAVVRAPSALAAVGLARDLARRPGVIEAVPEWFRQRLTRAIPDDPLFPNQWHLRNTGQGGGSAGVDADVTPVWDTYKGSADEIVAIIDDGVETGHEDLAANIMAGLGWDYVGGDDDPSPGNGDDHGTACAGVAAARGFNAMGVSGAAPQAGLVGLRLLGAETDANEAAALTRSQGSIDIRSSSWGPSDDRHLEAPGPLAQAALADGVTNGRGGRGTIFVWAGGNGKAESDNANYDGYANSRYAIAVAACTNGGDQAWYSEPGADLLVTAPSNGGTLGITTVDRSGSPGYGSGNYTSSFGGTSAACPLVAGSVALMLQANPQLTWRDVQAILATTAVKNDPADAGWSTNGAGYHVNHKYGFGLVSADNAVAAATTWTPLGPEQSAQGSATPGVAIPDADATGVSSDIGLADAIAVESVEVVFTAPHTFWADLHVELVSPQGTVSVLAKKSLTSGQPSQYDHWRFTTRRCFGETAAGTWRLRVSDRQSGDTGTFSSWSLKVYGHPSGPWTDTTAPVTTAVGAGGWHNGPVTVILSAFDPDSAVARTEYRLDSGPWTVGTQVAVAAPADHSNDGSHLLEFRSYDSGDGPTEALKSAQVRIDTLGPDARASRRVRACDWGYATVRYRVNDATSPKATVTVRVKTPGGRTVKILRLGERPTNVGLTTRFVCRLEPRTYRWFVYARDLAQNRQTHVGVNRLVVH